MKFFRYSLVCFFCGLLVFCTGCQKKHETVVNTNSGVVIHSSDFTVPVKQKVAAASLKKHQPEADSSRATMKGNVINLGGGYEEIDLGPVFRDN